MSTLAPCRSCQRPCWGERCAECRDTLGAQEVTGDEATAILGITYRQLDHWATTVLGRKTGIGRRRRFTLGELITLANIAALVRAGMTPTQAYYDVGKSTIEHPWCVIHVDIFGIKAEMAERVQQLRGAA